MQRVSTIKTRLISALTLSLAIFALLTQPLKSAPLSGTESQLETLFENLSTIESFDESQMIVNQIWQIWITNNDDATNLKMMRRGISFMDSGNFAIAEEVFTRIIKRDPSFTEAWNKRATVRYIMNDIRGSESDIYETLMREPRHFGAMAGLGLIRVQQGLLSDALTIYQDILKINPQSPDAVKMVPELETILRGDPV